MANDNNKQPLPEEHDKSTAEADEALLEQKRKDALLQQEQMRKWIEEDKPLPVKMSCKLSQHIVAKENKTD